MMMVVHFGSVRSAVKTCEVEVADMARGRVVAEVV